MKEPVETPAPRVTQKEVARIAGVSHVTVSLALRGRPEIPTATRERIEAIARDLGYSPDPMLGALSAYRRTQRPPAFQSNLAWINNHPEPEELRQSYDFNLYYEGARERAKEVGYGLETVNLVDYDYERLSVQRMLRARGINGLLIAPLHDHRDHIDLDWQHFSAVRFGYSMLDTVLNTVTPSQYRASYAAVEQLMKNGYRRIGYISDDLFNTRTGGHFLGGYLSAQAHFSAEQIPTLRMSPRSGSDDTEYWLPAKAWVEEHRPQVILASSHHVYYHLQRWGYRVPEDVGVASLSVGQEEGTFSGMCQNPRFVGRAAVDLLVAMSQRKETGIPQTPKHMLIEGVWIPGKTTISL